MVPSRALALLVSGMLEGFRGNAGALQAVGRRAGEAFGCRVVSPQPYRVHSAHEYLERVLLAAVLSGVLGQVQGVVEGNMLHVELDVEQSPFFACIEGLRAPGAAPGTPRAAAWAERRAMLEGFLLAVVRGLVAATLTESWSVVLKGRLCEDSGHVMFHTNVLLLDS